MKKEKAKTITCLLLGLESIGVMAAFVVGVLTVAEWGNSLLSVHGSWVITYGFYLLAFLAAVYGFILRPLRRKAISIFSSAVYPTRKIRYAEAVFVLLFVLSGYLHCFWLSIPVLTAYSVWKLVEILGDLLLFNRRSGCFSI